ncbi:class I SAM-dependent methyltransferase [Vibrio ostreicida]|uniref:Class I SAM-dependent methyltransferase n=1 Tax=Vibrio ostreicida TaxID=526588 RepID=A0ABT8BZK5_9VIBR|nr:class I SAM-dependent methyltransferase [Vibrio ostreicida]MDN3611480.1 class I SAM-dependent methyltransferase [Vibrio ostreicida]NPD08979.1 class I SAM-dependent methyltransferase [Vibrio ostreicida]
MNNDAVIAGQAVYSKKILSIYDLWVLGFSNHFLWKCPTKRIGHLFSALASTHHLDVGVGTGYYLKKYLTSNTERIALLDLNRNSLGSTSKAIEHLDPEIYCQNALEPLSIEQGFDSVSVNYLLHCLPGSIPEKSQLFTHLKAVMNPGGVLFGSTILGQGTARNAFATKLMAFYNKKGIFSNSQDDLNGLETALQHEFCDVNIDVVGCVALFSARKA